MRRSDILDKEYHPYYKQYLDLTPDEEYARALSKSADDIVAFLSSIPTDLLEYRYDKGKWTIKEIIQHLIDTERIFCYRALRIARKDLTPISGYEQDDYVVPSKANRLTLEQLLDDYKATRACTISLYRSMDEEMLCQIGNANGNGMSARAALFVMVGHEIHHCNVIRERYL